MSTQRTPPPSVDGSESFNVAKRKKPAKTSPTAFDQSDLEFLTSTRSEIQSAVDESVRFAINSYFKKEFNALKSELATLKDVEASMKFLSADYDLIKKELEESRSSVTTLTKSNSELSNKVEDLSARLNIMEQHSRETNIEINGVPENKSENLVILTKQLGSAVSFPIQESEIQSCSRVRKMDESSNRPRSIIVKLANTRTRDGILASVSKYNRSNPTEKLHSGLLGYAGSKVPVYVSEHLSPYYKALHAQTRKVARENNIKYVWIRNGRINIRKDDGSPAKQIKCYDSLKVLQGN